MPVYDLTTHEKTVIELSQFSKVNTFPSALSMALRHLGMVLLPDNAAKPLIKSGELVHLITQFTGPKWPLHTYHREKAIHLTRFHQLLCHNFNNVL